MKIDWGATAVAAGVLAIGGLFGWLMFEPTFNRPEPVAETLPEPSPYEIQHPPVDPHISDFQQ